MIQFSKLLADIGLVSLSAKLLAIFINPMNLLLNLSLVLSRQLLSHTKTIFLSSFFFTLLITYARVFSLKCYFSYNLTIMP